MQFIICKICGFTMGRGNRSCTRCKSKNLSFQEFYMEEDSLSLWQRLERSQQPFNKKYASGGLSLAIVVVVITATVGIYGHHIGYLDFGKPTLLASKIK
ncbi:MAG: hypothetical protein K2Z81_18670 [Cyanobacteria bacterium]|nr:hypothetical protein [Cyanobacteriota bacterium]